MSTHWRYNEQHYLAVFQVAGEKVELFRWNGTQFVLQQTLNLASVSDISPFEADGHLWVAISSHTSGNHLYTFDGLLQRAQTLSSAERFCFIPLTVGDLHYLYLSAYESGGSSMYAFRAPQ